MCGAGEEKTMHAAVCTSMSPAMLLQPRQALTAFHTSEKMSHWATRASSKYVSTGMAGGEGRTAGSTGRLDLLGGLPSFAPWQFHCYTQLPFHPRSPVPSLLPPRPVTSSFPSRTQPHPPFFCSLCFTRSCVFCSSRSVWLSRLWLKARCCREGGRFGQRVGQTSTHMAAGA